MLIEPLLTRFPLIVRASVLFEAADGAVMEPPLLTVRVPPTARPPDVPVRLIALDAETAPDTVRVPAEIVRVLLERVRLWIVVLAAIVGAFVPVLEIVTSSVDVGT
jgi:hypothetical protein